MGSQSLPKSTEDIIAVLDSVSHGSFNGDEVERLRVRAAARRMLARVESPYERAWGFCFEHPQVFAAIQTTIDLGVWGKWTAAGGGDKTLDEIVQFCNAEVATNLLRTLILLCLVLFFFFLVIFFFICLGPLIFSCHVKSMFFRVT